MDLRRGLIVAVASPGSFSKPRPALALQSGSAELAETVVVALITSELQRQPGYRIPVNATAQNGLRSSSEVMVDLLQAIPVEKVGRVIGEIERETLVEVDAALRLLLELP